MESWYLFTLSKPEEFENNTLEYVKSFFQQWFYWPRCYNDKKNIIVPNVFELFWINEWDNIYFFIDRKIYWIWKVIKKDESIIHKDNNWNYWFHFTKYFDDELLFEWIDMDELLWSDNNSYSMIRILDWVSYIKLDIEENLRLRWFILSKSKKITLNSLKKLKTTPITWSELVINNSFYDWKNKITNEKVIETGILNMYINFNDDFTKYFWNLDYFSSQIPASPQKPVKYMDKIDLFWYKLIKNHILTKDKFIIIELKRDLLKKDDVYQLLKYVDYVSKNYCGWDYWMINAYLLWAPYIKWKSTKEKELIDILSLDKNNRNYVLWRNLEPLTWKWKNIKIINYLFNWDKLILNNVN